MRRLMAKPTWPGALLFVAATSFAAPTAPTDKCPDPVKSAIARSFPNASITTCKAEREDGHDQFEVKIAKKGGGVAEVDISPNGDILQVEETIPLDGIPAAVTKAFATKYPKAKIEAAEKQTPTHGTPSYELAFMGEHGRREATFAENGTFVEEE